MPRSVKDPLASNEANVTGTVKVLVAAKDCGVPAVVAASSSSVWRHPRRRDHPRPLDADHIVVVSGLPDSDLPKRPPLGHGIEESCFSGQ